MRRINSFRGISIRNSSSYTPENRFNDIGIQSIPESIHSNLFDIPTKVPTEKINISTQLLERFNLYGKKLKPMKTMHLPLPKLVGENLAQHFHLLGLEQAEPALSICKRMSSYSSPPPFPGNWSRESGWTEYKNGVSKSVKYPSGECLVFDVEVLVKEGSYPCMAVAATPEAWFSWVSPELFKEKEFKSLIPFGCNEERVIIGHNVGYDRARILEEYSLESTKNQFIDTISLHNAIFGICNPQRITRRIWDKQTDEAMINDKDVDKLTEPKWFDHVSASSLADVTKFYLKEEMSKELRNYFVDGTRKDIQDRFDELMGYCAKDVFISLFIYQVENTFKIYSIIFPKFLEACPHPVSFSGILHMGKQFLTVNDSWDTFIQKADDKYKEMSSKIEIFLLDMVESALTFQKDDEWKNDPWLMNLDWGVKKSKPIKKIVSKSKKIKEVSPVAEKRLRKAEALLNKPEWYRSLWDPITETIKIGLLIRITPYLLRLSYNGHPLYHNRPCGWMYKVPKSHTNDPFISSQNSDSKPKDPLVFSNDPKDNYYDEFAFNDTSNDYYRLPHPEGDGKNIGNPFSKPFISDFESGVMSSSDPKANEILKIHSSLSYWIGSRSRITNQFIVKSPDIPDTSLIIPPVIVMGTITRRAVERTWMTLSNPKPNRLGSEVKSMVRSPQGYKFVGADVDSEELWIASLFGDSLFGIHGATPLGYMTLQGEKKNGTDLHSVTASILRITRDDAKVFNYARIYGAGVRFATKLLSKCSKETDEKKLTELAKQLYFKTKGYRGKYLDNDIWYGGSESFVFNFLEKVIQNEEARTPVLKCSIPGGLTKSKVDKDFLTSRINWVVQSSGVDYLHLIIVAMDYLIRRMNIKARFMLSIHDEVRYLVKEEHQHLAAYALQIANLWVRSFFSYQVGIDDLPLSVAFFSNIDIDHCMRKEVFLECVTPSNTEPIPPGLSQDIYDTLENIPKDDLFGPELDSINELKKNNNQINLETRDLQTTQDIEYIKLQSESSPHQFQELKNRSDVGKKVRIRSQTPIKARIVNENDEKIDLKMYRNKS